MFFLIGEPRYRIHALDMFAKICLRKLQVSTVLTVHLLVVAAHLCVLMRAALEGLELHPQQIAQNAYSSKGGEACLCLQNLEHAAEVGAAGISRAVLVFGRTRGNSRGECVVVRLQDVTLIAAKATNTCQGSSG